MDRSGKWTLAPAYDVSFAYNPAGAWTSSHQMTINGKRKNIEEADFEPCAKIAGLKNAEKQHIIAEVRDSVGKWMEFASSVGVKEERAALIDTQFPMC